MSQTIPAEFGSFEEAVVPTTTPSNLEVLSTVGREELAAAMQQSMGMEMSPTVLDSVDSLLDEVPYGSDIKDMLLSAAGKLPVDLQVKIGLGVGLGNRIITDFTEMAKSAGQLTEFVDETKKQAAAWLVRETTGFDSFGIDELSAGFDQKMALFQQVYENRDAILSSVGEGLKQSLIDENVWRSKEAVRLTGEGRYLEAAYQEGMVAGSVFAVATGVVGLAKLGGKVTSKGLSAISRSFAKMNLGDDVLKLTAETRAFENLRLGDYSIAGSQRGALGPRMTPSKETIHFGQRRVGPKFSDDPRFPHTSGKTLDEVVQNLKDPNHPLTADDLPITAFRDPETGLLVSQNTRTRAALADAGIEPTKVDIVDLNSLSKRQRAKYLNRLIEEPVLEGNILPSLRVPMTPTMNDLSIMRVIEIQ